jgi:alpha-tubulin suppressor-like RCC1 family protein
MGFSTFIITADGIYCSGNNGYGELGLKDWDVRTEPTKMKAFEGVHIIQIVGGLHHVLFLDSMGVVWGTGRNDDGQIGLEKEIEFVNYPMKVPFDKKISKIACGTSSFHSYAVDFDGNLYTCGQNQYEQLGYDSSSSCFGFKKVDTKGRKCDLVHGGCQYTILALTMRNK